MCRILKELLKISKKTQITNLPPPQKNGQKCEQYIHRRRNPKGQKLFGKILHLLVRREILIKVMSYRLTHTRMRRVRSGRADGQGVKTHMAHVLWVVRGPTVTVETSSAEPDRASYRLLT